MAQVHKQAERDYMLGMKYKDIASKYGVTLNTVKSWKKRFSWQRKFSAPQKDKAGAKKTGCKSTLKHPPVTIKIENEELTEKQKLFCLFYVNNKNAAQAVIKAGYEVANAQRAAEIGYQLLQNYPVRQEVERLKALKRQSIMLTDGDIVERYMRIAFADMTDFVEFGIEYVPVLDKNGIMQIDNYGNIKCVPRNYINFKNHDQVDGGLICEIKMGRQGMSLKLEDRQKALDWLSDYFNMNPMNKHRQWYDQEKLKLNREEINHRKENDKIKNW